MNNRVWLSALLGLTIAGNASAQNQLNIYNWSDYIAEDTIANFEEEFGIEVNYDVYDSNEVLEAKLLAGSSGYDIVVPTGDFLERQIQAGVYQKLDRDFLPNIRHMDQILMKTASTHDANNDHSVIYMWGTTGIGYNIDKVKQRLGGKVPNSWDLVFNPEIANKLKDCGISWLDAPTEVLPAALNYLGFDPNSQKPSELKLASYLLNSVRGTVRYIDSSRYIDDLANGETCVAIGWSGDVFQARDRADEADAGVSLAYIIPDEGALAWYDMLAIPKDAKNVEEAHAFINYIMRPKVTADITNYVWYANANFDSLKYVDEEILEDPAVFPPESNKWRLWSAKVSSQRYDRLRTRSWTRIKTGK